jgi:hypothetical protein
MLDKLKAHAWMFTAAALAALLLWQTTRLWGAEIQISQLQLQHAQTIAKQSQDLAKAQAAARSAEAGLQAGAAGIRKETNDQVHSLAAHRDALVRRLRVAESNLATARLVSETTAAARAGQAAGGGGRPELPASIGEEDVAEAERADVIRLHLAACYAQYDRAQEALKGLGARSGQ